MNNTKRFFCVLIAAALFMVGAPLHAAESEPGVYLLFVWGTLDENTLRCVEISEKKLESAFVEDASPYAKTGAYNTVGRLVELNQYVKKTLTLKGADATPENILKECRELSEVAGPNDAVMVYILCHGATIKGKDGKLRHGIAPIATNAKELQLNRFGIARSTIMKAIKTKPHRLNVLITDSCMASEPFQLVPGLLEAQSLCIERPYLTPFLLKAKGDLNVNSSCPDKPTAPGELTRGCAPTKWANVPSDPDAREAYELYAGTVFTNAFLQVAKDYCGESSDYTVDVFFEKLRLELDRHYFETKAYFKETNQAYAYTTFNRQKTQTLTRFDDDGVAFPEDLKYESKYANLLNADSDKGQSETETFD